MNAHVQRDGGKVCLDGISNFENVDPALSHMKAIRCVLAYEGQSVDWDWLLGASGEAFCCYYHPDGTHLTQFVHSWDIANAALSLYGFAGQWWAASTGPDIAPAWPVMEAEIAAGRPIIAPGIKPGWNGINSLCDHWFVITGVDPAAGKVTILGAGDAAVETLLPTGDDPRPYPQGIHPCWYGILRHIEPGKSLGHYGPDKPMLVVTRIGPTMDPKTAALAALERAVQLAHEPSVTAQGGWGMGTYLAGLTSLQRMHDDLLAARGDGETEYRRLNPTKEQPFSGLLSELEHLRLLAARRHAAAGFLRQAAELLPDCREPLWAAAEQYEHVAEHAMRAFEVCFKSETEWLSIQAVDAGGDDPDTHIGRRAYYRKSAKALAYPANRQIMAEHLAAIIAAEHAAIGQIEDSLTMIQAERMRGTANLDLPRSAEGKVVQ